MTLTNIQTAVNREIIDCIDIGISKKQWKSAYDFLKMAIIEKLTREGFMMSCLTCKRWDKITLDCTKHEEIKP